MSPYYKAYTDGAKAALVAMEAVLHDKTSPQMMRQMIDKIRQIILEAEDVKETKKIDRLQ